MSVILVVEDEHFIREMAGWVIEDMGHNTLRAGNFADAISHLGAPGQIDGLFVDIRLHALALGGYEVANQAISLRPGLRVLYTSGTPLSPDMTDLFVEGGRFLQKPYTPDQLELCIGALLN